MTPQDLVEELLSEARVSPDDPLVAKVLAAVENYIGDVIGEETSEEQAQEECWTLAIDAANDRIRDRDLAIAVAKEVCHQIGYTPKGYRPQKQKSEKPVWPPRAANSSNQERVVKPTGVVHGPYRPPFMDNVKRSKDAKS